MKIPAKIMAVLVLAMIIGTGWVVVTSYSSHFAHPTTQEQTD